LARFNIRPLERDDCAWVARFTREQWHAEFAVVHGAIFRPDELPGFVALDDNPIGLITYHLDGDACEIVSLNSLEPKCGVGSALIERVVKVARESGCRKVWLITTNDNLNALGFYQKRGFVLVAVHRDAVNASRQIKPEIPLLGENGIPIRDEIELEMIL